MPKRPSFLRAFAWPLSMALCGFAVYSGAAYGADRPQCPAPSLIPDARAFPWRWSRRARYREGGNSVHWITENRISTGVIQSFINRLYGVYFTHRTIDWFHSAYAQLAHDFQQANGRYFRPPDNVRGGSGAKGRPGRPERARARGSEAFPGPQPGVQASSSGPRPGVRASSSGNDHRADGA